MAVALPLRAQDISFNPAITEADFQKFSRLIAQGIFPSPVQPAGASGLLRFDVGIAATGVKIDPNATYWQRAVGKDFTVGSNYVAVPRLVASKGLSAATIAASYAKVQGTNGSILGGSLDVPVINGGLVKPTLALRGSYATLRGIDVYNLNTYGLELFLGKGFGPITPYGAIGKQRSNATGNIPATTRTPEITLTDRSTITRYTAGAQVNLVIFRLAVEANQAEQRSYGVKLSFGF
ncbi:MAG TPA: DUF6588 family protein [Thermoanaerobaculia bacterium]